MRARWWVWSAAVGLVWLMTGCVSVKAPERVTVNAGGPEPVDSSRLPATNSHAEAREELRKAYANLQHLERVSDRLDQKLEKCKRELDRCEERLERYEDD